MSASKFTPQNRAALLERTTAGVSLTDAARTIGIREATVKGWVTRGRREGSGDYAEFVAALDTARQEAKDRPGPLTREEFDLRLSYAVRGGSVAAMKLWAELHVSPPEAEPEGNPLAEIDELAERRQARG